MNIGILEEPFYYFRLQRTPTNFDLIAGFCSGRMYSPLSYNQVILWFFSGRMYSPLSYNQVISTSPPRVGNNGELDLRISGNQGYLFIYYWHQWKNILYHRFLDVFFFLYWRWFYKRKFIYLLQILFHFFLDILQISINY